MARELVKIYLNEDARPSHCENESRAYHLIRSEPHPYIDVLCGGHPLHECEEGLVDHWHQQAVDDEAREVVRRAYGLSESGQLAQP